MLKPNLYEKIAMDMRSKTYREEIQWSLKQARTQKRMAQNLGDSNTNRQEETLQGGKSAQTKQQAKGSKSAATKTPFNCRHNQPGGHDIWGNKPKGEQYDVGPTQWEACITRDNAQYRLIEKLGRENDNYHEITYKTVDGLSKATHFDDQPMTEAR